MAGETAKYPLAAEGGRPPRRSKARAEALIARILPFELVPMLASVLAMVSWLYAVLGLIPLLLLAVVALYAIYVIKMRLRIDIFPRWGLHLHGPRTLLRRLVAKRGG
jgi:hypothetical protein